MTAHVHFYKGTEEYTTATIDVVPRIGEIVSLGELDIYKVIDVQHIIPCNIVAVYLRPLLS